jgi:hypothetical protein
MQLLNIYYSIQLKSQSNHNKKKIVVFSISQNLVQNLNDFCLLRTIIS